MALTKEQAEARELVEKYGGFRAASRESGIPVSTLRCRIKAAGPVPLQVTKVSDEGADIEQDDKKQVIVLTSKTKRTIPQVLAECEVDEQQWRVKRSKVSKHDGMAKLKKADGTEHMAITELYRVWIELERRKPLEHASIIPALIEDLRDACQDFPPLPLTFPPQPGKPLMAEVAIMDPHFGKLSWGEETGEENQDLKIMLARVERAVDLCIEHMRHRNVERILLPLGNDMLHVDNDNNMTAAGTPQDTDGRIKKVYRETFKLIVQSVAKLVQIAPVDVIEVEGNHDPLLTYTLCHALEQRFWEDDRINVDVRPLDRKYYQYGRVCLGFTHKPKKGEDLPRLMADEVPQLWAACPIREIHCGHIHKEYERSYTSVDTFGSTKMRIIPSLCSSDKWHAEQGYVGTPKEAQLFFWHAEDGLEMLMPIRVPMGRSERRAA